MNLLKVLLRIMSPGPPNWIWHTIEVGVFVIGGMVLAGTSFSDVTSKWWLAVLLVYPGYIFFLIAATLVSEGENDSFDRLLLPPTDQIRMIPSLATALAGSVVVTLVGVEKIWLLLLDNLDVALFLVFFFGCAVPLLITPFFNLGQKLRGGIRGAGLVWI